MLTQAGCTEGTVQNAAAHLIQILYLSTPNGSLRLRPEYQEKDKSRPGSSIFEFCEGYFSGTYSSDAYSVCVLSLGFNAPDLQQFETAQRITRKEAA